MSTQPPIDLDTAIAPHVPIDTRSKPPDAPILASDTLKKTEPKDAPVQGMSPIARAGVDLAKWVLVIVSGFMIVAVVVLVWSEGKSLSLAETSYSRLSNPETSSATATAVQELIDQIDAQRKAFREFWHEFAQMVLLNLLLPVLTAILGYVFGSREGK